MARISREKLPVGHPFNPGPGKAVIIFGQKKPAPTQPSESISADGEHLLSDKELHRLALEKGMQSPEFMQAADARMMKSLDNLRKSTNTAPAPSSRGPAAKKPPDSNG